MTLKNFDIPVLNPKGEPYIVDGAPVTMREEIFTALMHPTKWDDNLYMRKAAAAALGMAKIYAGGEVDLTPAEIEIIKERVCLIIPPISAHRILTYLEDKPEKPTGKKDK